MDDSKFELLTVNVRTDLFSQSIRTELKGIELEMYRLLNLFVMNCNHLQQKEKHGIQLLRIRMVLLEPSLAIKLELETT